MKYADDHEVAKALSSQLTGHFNCPGSILIRLCAFFNINP